MFICTHMYIHINTYTNIFRELKKTSPHISGIQRYPHFQFLIYKPNTYTNSHYLSTIHIKSTFHFGCFPGKPGYLLKLLWEKPAQQDNGASLRSQLGLT